MKKAIVIGATSGIGKALAVVLSKEGYGVGITGRRVPLLDELAGTLSGPVIMKPMDVSDPSRAIPLLEELIEEMEGVDLVVISAGTGHVNEDLDWSPEEETLQVNVLGFAAMANVAFRHFQERGEGHLVGITSLAALRGSRVAPAYNASKAFEVNYLEGLRVKAHRLGLPITVTDIMPGFVDTAMAKGEGIFWAAPPEKAARQIYQAIEGRRPHAYITTRWRLFAWLLKILPWFLYRKF